MPFLAANRRYYKTLSKFKVASATFDGRESARGRTRDRSAALSIVSGLSIRRCG